MPLITNFYAIETYLKNSKWINSSIFFFCKESSKIERLLNLVNKRNVKIQRIDLKILKQFGSSHCVLETPNEIIPGKIQSLENQIRILALQKIATILVIDGVTDPHNIGAILRNCTLFAVDLVLYPKRNSAKLNTDTILRISTGASNITTHKQVSNITQTLKILKENNFWIFGVHTNGKNLLHHHQHPKKSAFVVGSEGKGISKLVLKNCDETIKIASTQRIQCLNVSVATGIVLHHRYVSSFTPQTNNPIRTL